MANRIAAVMAWRVERTWADAVVASRVLVGVLALLVYIPTLPPTVLWGGGDFARNQVWAYSLHLEGGPEGHPLWTILVHPLTWLPVGDVAYRVNLSSALLAALALVLVFTAIFDLTASLAGAWLGTVALAVSHTFWTYALMPKVYALNSLFLALAFVLALRWARSHRPACLYGLAVTFILGAYSHLLFILLAPAFAVYLLCVRRRGAGIHMAGAALLFMLLAFPAVLSAPIGAPDTTSGAMGRMLVHQLFSVLVSPRSLALGIGVGIALLAYQFFATLAVAALGLRDLVRRQWALALLFGLVTLLDTGFVFAWTPPSHRLFDYANNWHFYLPTYLVVAILAGCGFASLASRLGTWAAKGAAASLVIAIPVAVYAAAPHVARGALRSLDVRTLPGRDNARYLLSPWKQDETGARAYGQRMMDALPRNATLLADYGIYWVARYFQDVAGRRPDVRLVQLPDAATPDRQAPVARLEAQRGRRLFIPDTNRYYDIAALTGAFRVVPYGPVYELIPIKPPPAH